MSKLYPQTIITSHRNADFDALSSMVAASKIYPDAVLVAPNFLERRAINSFSKKIAQCFNLVQSKECDFSQVTLLVVTDTRNRERIPHVEEVFKNQNLHIHLFDHHPDSINDIIATQQDVRSWGATTTILTSIIEERGITLTPDEATMISLGIYEDTGSFTFSSTTEHDLTAAAFALRNGADLSIVHELMSTELTSQQVHILGTLLKNSTAHNIHGLPVTMTEIILDDFLGDFSTIVDKFMEIEKFKVVLCLATMHDRVHLIIRSFRKEIDAGKICTYFGGGGHDTAASACIKELTATEVKPELLALLSSSIRPQATVGSQMTSPAKTVFQDTTLSMAKKMMTRYGLKAVPVLDKESGYCVGLLDLQTANRAHLHDLGALPVEEYIQENFFTLAPEADLYQAMDIILKQRQRLIPITHNNLVQGVLTRTDILRLFVDENSQNDELQQHGKERNIAEMMKSSLPSHALHLLDTVGKLADTMNFKAFIVGGFVRDLLLGHINLDLDLSIEGDALAFATELAKKLNGHTKLHPKFQTAVVFYKDDLGNALHIDIATTRLEFYDRPGALPTVELSSINMDLYRRDFTINALAVQINTDCFGLLIDSFGGQRDIKAKRIAVMHSLSFIEDPTRILRAIRFEQRYKFCISQQAERLIKNARSLHMIGNISGSRLFRELSHIFNEKTVTACLKRMQEWHILEEIHPLLQLKKTNEKLCTNIDEILSWYSFTSKDQSLRRWVLYLLALCSTIKHPDVKSLLERLGFTEKVKKEFLHLRWLIQRASTKLQARAKNNDQSLSHLYEALSPLSIEGQLYLLAKYKGELSISKDILLYLTKLKDISLDISGEDLCAIGYRPGPIIGKILKQILMAKLDGKISSREDQLSLAIDLVDISYI